MINMSRRDILCVAGATAVTAASGARAAAAAPPLSLYSKLPHVEAVALSPDAARIAYGTTQDGQKIICDCVIATGQTYTAQLIGPVLRELMWIDNTTLLSVSTKVFGLREFAGGNNEYLQAVIMNIPARRVYQLYNNLPLFNPIITGNVNRVTINGEARVTASNAKLINEEWDSLYSFSIRNGQGRVLDEAGFNILQWVVTPQGMPLGRSERNRMTGLWSLRYNDGTVNTAKWRTIYSEHTQADVPSLEGLGRDGKSLLVYMPTGEKGGGYYEVAPDGTFSAPLPISGNDVSPIFHPQTRALAGFADSRPSGVDYTFYDGQLQKVSQVIAKALPHAYFNRLASFAEDPRKLVVYSEGPSDSGTYYYIDIATGDNQILDNTYPDLPVEWLCEKKVFAYRAGDGLAIEAFITLPPKVWLGGRDAKNLACVVLPHGGPQARDDIGFDWMAQALASRGYLVLQANFRGSDGYGKAFVEAGYGEWGRKMQTDLSDGIRALVAQDLVDPQRVAIAGASYGGFAALAGATLDTGVYTCAAAVAPVSDLATFVDWVRTEAGGDPDSPSVLYWKRFMGDKSGWAAASPAQQAAKVTIPVLLIHGKDDDTVPIDQSYRMRDALQKAGKPVELVLLKDEDHYLSKEPTRIQTLDALMAFLLIHNPPA